LAIFPTYKVDHLINETGINICKKVLLRKNIESSKAILCTFIKKIVVYEDRIDVSGSKLNLLSNVANNKAGDSSGVPSFISIWQG